jgi:maltose-binding protein MalE
MAVVVHHSNEGDVTTGVFVGRYGMLRKRKIARWLAGLAICLLVLASWGCQFRSEPDTTIQLTWWVTFAVESAEYAALERIAEAYNAQADNVTVELVAVPWDEIAPRGAFATQLSLAQEDGEGPDLWGPVPHSWSGSFAQQAQVLSLAPDQIDNYGQYADVALDGCQMGKELYGLPVLMDAIGLIYNRALVPQPPQDFAEVVAIAQELRDDEQGRWGLALPLLSPYHVYPFMDAYGGYLFDCSAQACDLSDLGIANEGAARGVQYLSDLYVKEGLFPQELADRAVMYDYALEQFVDGQVGMLIDGPWVLDQVRDSGIDYGVMSIPVLPEAEGAARPLTMVQALYVSAYSAHPEDTVDLMNYVSGQEGIVALQEAVGGAPVRRDLLRVDAFRQEHELRVWHNLAVEGVILANVPEIGYVWRPWSQALDEAIPGLRPAQESLDQAAEEIVRLLEADQEP